MLLTSILDFKFLEYIAPRLVYSLSIEFILGSWKYNGQCFKDSSNRVLDATWKKDRSNMTIEKCLEFCSNGGYAFAGVESEYECFCGNNAPSQNPIDDSECNSKCSGDSTQICGGSWKINIYSVGKTSYHLKCVNV